MKWKWSNIPVPEAHVVGLVVGILLTLLWPRAVFANRWMGIVSGGLLALVAVALAGWAVWEASDMAIDSPDRLLAAGPYALSRNPMYVAWTLIALGTALLLNTIWLLVLLPFVLLYVHLVDIRSEERQLQEQFGREYVEYCGGVRRYL